MKNVGFHSLPLPCHPGNNPDDAHAAQQLINVANYTFLVSSNNDGV
jgi:hypothetical protein